jgi:hypothetical protein
MNELDFQMTRTRAVVREAKKAFSKHHGQVARRALGIWPGFEYQLNSWKRSPHILSHWAIWIKNHTGTNLTFK